MNTGRFHSHSLQQRSISRTFGLAVSALAAALCLALANIPSRAHADLIPMPALAEKPGSVTHGHVFIYTPPGPVDVTYQIGVVNAQTYVFTDQGGFPIFIDSDKGNVYDCASCLIGFVDLS